MPVNSNDWLEKELPMDTPSESSGEGHFNTKSTFIAHVPQQLYPHSQVIEWTKNLTDLLDGIKSLPLAEARLLEAGKTKFPNLPIIRIGLRHTPCEAEKGFRTITISNLPSNTSMDQVLRAIRGGEVLSACMCNTVRITGFLTAFITFVNSSGAAKFLSIAEQEGCYVAFQKVEVNLVGTPTYPMRRILQDRIVNRGRTRTLTICSADRSIKRTVHLILSDSIVAAYIEGFKEHQTREEITILFHSIEMAMRAYKLLQVCPGIEKMWFGSDPCGKTPQNEDTPPN
ncbi:uncharacterized protein N7529_002807 [Penicillium soppii]|uniref:uncharacterized protein n=1 Tax=Penicillium soppii TaxID=69789 RepID=UPI0025478A91|nr:uncharacterized protein N7529_002807 [Penicillium soppii]KAJ5874377.1 hypothetical protein N7529_002807 [Penicillium soppii]